MEWVRLADTSGLRVVAMSHESYQATRRSSRYRRVKEHYPAADRMLVLTAEDADAWARDGMTNVDHIPNPLRVTPDVYPTLDLPVVACVGRLSYEKGVDLLLEVWERVSARHPGWRLHIYGDGPDEAELRVRAAAAGLSGSVEFRGWCRTSRRRWSRRRCSRCRPGRRASRCRSWRRWLTGCPRSRSTALRASGP